MSLSYFTVPQSAPVPMMPSYAPHPTITVFGFRHLFVFAIVVAVLWYLGRALGTFGLGAKGSQITLSVALLVSALMSQIIMKAPHVLGEYETFSIFSLGLVASFAAIFQMHYSLYGWAL